MPECKFLRTIACLAWTVALSAPVFQGQADELLLVDWGAQWRYSTNGAAPGLDWAMPEHDDSSWATGAAPFAYPADELYWLMPQVPTVLPRYLPNSTQIITHFFRVPFVIPEGQFVAFLVISNFIDDGVLYYLNGIEVARLRISEGLVTTNTLAQFQGNEGVVEMIKVSSIGLRAGTNWLAAELHQSSATSADAVFFSRLHASTQIPVRITGQPADLEVQEHSPVLLQSTATGENPAYNWYQNGILIPGATNPMFQVSYARYTNAGDYAVVVTNHVSQATSRVARVTIVPDTIAPQVWSGVEDLSTTNTLQVTFSEPVLSTTAVAASNYTVQVRGSGEPLRVQAAILAGNNVVRLRTVAWDTNLVYELIVTGVRDSSGNGNLIHMEKPIPICFARRNVSVLPAGSWWARDENGLDLGTAWREPEYSDADWPVGQAGFFFSGSSASQFCDSPKVTLLTAGYRTYYFRKWFVLPRATGTGHLRVRHYVDDGAVFYLNGEEVSRIRMPTGPINAATPAIAVSTATCENFTAVATNLVDGDNLLAVELHQATESSGSQDLAFEIELIADYLVLPPGPELHVRVSRAAGDALQLEWTGGAGTLEQASKPEGPWDTLGTNQPVLVFPTNTAGFYRVRGQ